MEALEQPPLESSLKPQNHTVLPVVADTIGQLMEFWGFKHLMGRIWTVLYLSPKPLSAPELADELSASAGAISMALRDLLAWGAIWKVCPQESRKDHYVAEQNLWKLISRVLHEREGRKIETAVQRLDEALATLEGHKKTFSYASSSVRQQNTEVSFQIGRLKELQKFANTGNKVLTLLLKRAKVDIRPLRHLFEEDHYPGASTANEISLKGETHEP